MFHYIVHKELSRNTPKEGAIFRSVLHVAPPVQEIPTHLLFVRMIRKYSGTK